MDGGDFGLEQEDLLRQILSLLCLPISPCPQRHWHAIACTALFRAMLALTLPYSLASCKFVFASFDVNFIFFTIFFAPIIIQTAAKTARPPF